MQPGEAPTEEMVALVVEFSSVNDRPAVRGELDILSLPELETWLAQLDENLSEIDLSGVTFFDSCALRAFLNVRRRNPHVRIVNPSATVLRVLEITGTVDYLVHGRDINW